MKNLAIILFIISLVSVSCQWKLKNKTRIAFDHYDKGDNYEALLIFKELVRDYPNSEQYGRILYNIPAIYQELDSTEMAIKWFQLVLNDENLDDSEKDYSRGIFETNTNFKHYASFNIGVMNYNNENYSEALKFYKLAIKQYPYYNSSGTDLKLNQIKIASNISDCYSKLNQIETAIVVLLPHALTESPRATNYASEKIINLVKEHERESLTFKELDKSFDNLEIRSKGIRLNCYGIDVNIHPYADEELSTTYLKNTMLYIELKKASNNR